MDPEVGKANIFGSGLPCSLNCLCQRQVGGAFGGWGGEGSNAFLS